MKRTNAIIETLKRQPATGTEMPYHQAFVSMSVANRQRIRKICAIGSTNSKYKMGRVTTVYYLEGDEDRAAVRFAEANYAALSKIERLYNSVLSRQIEKTLLNKIWIAHNQGKNNVRKT